MKIRYILIGCIVLSGFWAQAQLTVKGISRSQHQRNFSSGRTETGPLALPFWDDFSTSTNFPNSDLWDDSDDVWINDGMGIQPPSLNVATFDGLKVDGKPYSLDQLSDGLTDVLTSHAIDLSTLTSADNVFLSFFYQAKGNGEIPNENDSLRIEFKDLNGEWKKAWSVVGQAVTPDEFTQVSIPILNADYFHDDFQFKFKSYGRQSGPFDSWNVDYVYLNDNVTNFDFPDRAVQTKPTSIFKRYRSIPIHHFNQDPSQLLNLPEATAYNLFDLLQPSNFTLITDIQSYQPDQSIIVTSDTLAFEIISSFPDPQLTGIRQIDLVADEVLNSDRVQTDTLALLTLKLFMNTDDNAPPDYQPEFAPLDFRINDTTYLEQVLYDYYAYDDGSAEFAAGLNFAGDFVAYEFPMYFTGTDTLLSVDMYFPNFGGNVGGQLIELMVWKDLENNPGSLLHSEFVNLKAPEAINKFTNYLLESPVIVQDTFYLGWRQATAGSLDIGLDKNTDSGSRIFYNLDGTWQQNTKVQGSLMMRPKFGKVDLVLNNPPNIFSDIRIFPNPSSGTFRVEGPATELEVFSITGQRMEIDLHIEYDQQIVSLRYPRPGIYILRFIKDKQIHSQRIIIRN